MADRPSDNVRDDGLRRVLTWTLMALGAALLISLLGVYVVAQLFDGR
jgi:hypothetical protein